MATAAERGREEPFSAHKDGEKAENRQQSIDKRIAVLKDIMNDMEIRLNGLERHVKNQDNCEAICGRLNLMKATLIDQGKYSDHMNIRLNHQERLQYVQEKHMDCLERQVNDQERFVDCLERRLKDLENSTEILEKRTHIVENTIETKINILLDAVLPLSKDYRNMTVNMEELKTRIDAAEHVITSHSLQVQRLDSQSV